MAIKSKRISKPARRSSRSSSATKHLAQPVIKPTRNLPIQAKLTIGQPNDKYEQEADKIADQVMRMSDADVAQRVESGTVQSMRIQRMCPECEEEVQRQPENEEEEELQAKEMSGQMPTVAPNLESRINSLRCGGQPLDSATRSFFEPRFGHDFGHVRVHTDGQAAESARAVNARAYTVGRNVVFGEGQYAPGSHEGKRLVAHELVHTAQQSHLPISNNASSPLGLHTIQQRDSEDNVIHRMVSEVVINCADRQIHFQHDGETTSYSLDHCDVTEGTYDAGVNLERNTVDFDLGEVAEETHFDFHYSIEHGQTNPNTLLVGQSRVRIVVTNTPSVGGGIISFPVSYEATPMISLGFNPSSIPVTLGVTSHLGAMGDLSWLVAGGRMRWGDLMGWRMWSSFFTTEQGMITLDRIIHNPDVFSRLDPRIVGEMQSGRPYLWVRRGFLTEAELLSIPELVRQLNTEGIASLSAEELFVLRQAAKLHIGSSSPGAPFASYSLPGETAPFLQGAPTDGRVRYRVRVLIDRGAVLDVSAPSAFTHPQSGELGNFNPKNLLNAEEFEVLVTAGDNPRLVSVQRVAAGGAESSWMVRNAGAVRWAGRGLLVLGAGMSVYRIATASPEEQPRVVVEEAGGWGGGFFGAELTAGLCIAVGIATEGVGLLLCGLAGGIGGGVLGSSAASGLYDSAANSSCDEQCQADREARNESLGEAYANMDFCWVAREVIPEQWMDVRSYLLGEAPAWLRNTYGRYGQQFAAFIHEKPLLKAGLRPIFKHWANKGFIRQTRP